MRSRFGIQQAVQLVFFVLVLIFIAVYLINIDWARLDRLQLSWAPFVAATAIALLFRYWGAYIWLFLLGRLGAGSIGRNFAELTSVYAKAWLGRYLLGAGTWIVGKIYFASQHGVSKSKLAVSGVLESVLQLIATLVVGLGLLVLDVRLTAAGPSIGLLSVIALAACLVALIPAVFRFGIRLVYRVVRRKSIEAGDLPDWQAIVYGGLLYIAGTLITGISYFFVAQAVYAPLSWEDMVYVVGASSIASAVSLLAVFAPGGIGVREGIQVLFFSALMPVEVAVIVSVLMRLWSVLVDLLFFAVATGSLRLTLARRGRRGIAHS